MVKKNDHPMSNNTVTKNFCMNPPLRSKIIDECGKDCISTVTFIHDMSSDMNGRPHLINKLKKNHRIVTLNMRGHFNIDYIGGKAWKKGDDGTATVIPSYIPDPSKCKKKHGIDPYSMEMLTHDINRTLNKYGIGKTDVIGFSMGGAVAQAFASSYPNRVRKVAIGKTFTKFSPIARFATHPAFKPILSSVYWVWCNLRPKMNPEKDYGCNVPVTLLPEFARTIVGSDMTEYQKNIEAPTRVITCVDDIIFGEPVKYIKNMEEKRVQSCGHVFHSNNEGMYKEIENFLSD